ncbi:beta-galactosidase [Candidatus Dojkabacteria bacterium]|nr:beta-galactosidase [Candidatus Dojkabacteria bacterium]
MQLGTTFDIDYAKHLGLDWKNSLRQIINFGILPVRIGIKWSRVEEKKRKYNWKDYDEILNILEHSNTPTILVVGVKSPRWPEFFIPQWLQSDINDSQFKDELFKFISIVVSRYKKIKNIKWFQIENEPFLKMRSTNNEGRIKRIPNNLLKEEVQFVQSLTELPIILTAQGLPTTGILAEYFKGRNSYKRKLIELADIVGLHVYPKFEHESLLGKPKTFEASSRAWKYLENLHSKARTRGKECFCTELQAEPWQTKQVSMTDAYANETCNPNLVNDYIHRLGQIGFKKILVWGTEWHLACKKHGNSEWIEKIYRDK